MKTYKNCQSCGMPLKKDTKGGGTNSDGTISNMYCSLCYENGKFHNPEMTAQEMKTFVKAKLVEMGMPKFIAGFFSMSIPQLERWKNK